MDGLNAQIDRAKALLVAPEVMEASPWGALGAAFLAATAAVLMAGMVVLGPGVVIEDTPPPVIPAQR
jgi:hypothetical protein